MKTYFIKPTASDLERERENKSLRPLTQNDLCSKLWETLIKLIDQKTNKSI